jgi:hypothetical protein
MGGQKKQSKKLLFNHHSITGVSIYGISPAILIHFQTLIFGVSMIGAAFVGTKLECSALVGAVLDAPTTVFAIGS